MTPSRPVGDGALRLPDDEAGPRDRPITVGEFVQELERRGVWPGDVLLSVNLIRPTLNSFVVSYLRDGAVIIADEAR